MKKISLNDVTKYVKDNIGNFHSKRLKSLDRLKLSKILSRKNPYLFKAKNVLTAHDIIKGLLDAHLSSQEETIFGEFLEYLAIFICERVYSGKKSSAEGIDLEFDKKGIKYIVSIKSGPNWGNSSQIKKMKDNFRKAKRILGTNTSKQKIITINGCCYGREGRPDKGEYLKYCGQMFWEFISGNKNLYTKIIEPLGYKAKEKNEEFMEAYSQIINRFTQDFSKEFCTKGKINWKKLVRFNSSIKVT
ncbi:MAG: PmeII family type II restriction endonuclease [bacterium]